MRQIERLQVWFFKKLLCWSHRAPFPVFDRITLSVLVRFARFSFNFWLPPPKKFLDPPVSAAFALSGSISSIHKEVTSTHINLSTYLSRFMRACDIWYWSRDWAPTSLPHQRLCINIVCIPDNCSGSIRPLNPRTFAVVVIAWRRRCSRNSPFQLLLDLAFVAFQYYITVL